MKQLDFQVIPQTVTYEEYPFKVFFFIFEIFNKKLPHRKNNILEIKRRKL